MRLTNFHRYFVIQVTLILASFLLLPKEAQLGRIHNQSISLATLVEQTNLIVEAKPRAPSASSVKVDITPEGTPKGSKKYPPYDRTIYHFEVVDLLFGSPADIQMSGAILSPEQIGFRAGIQKGASLHVLRAHDRQALAVHRRLYLEGLHRSPVYESYQPELNLQEALELKQPLILFLFVDNGHVSFRASHSFETMKKKVEILKLLQEKK